MTSSQRRRVRRRTIAQTAVDNEKYFGDLDSVVGDGDFGYSLARGFEIVLERLGRLRPSDIGTFLQKIGVAITSRIGGTSGPIWGTAFLRAAGREGQGRARPATTPSRCCGPPSRGSWRAATPSSATRRCSTRSSPMTDTIEAALAAGEDSDAVAVSAAATARRAAEDTTPMIAKRGRAAYTGERSIGSPDAGAVAIAVIAEAIAAGWPTRGENADRNVDTENVEVVK